MSDSLEVCYEAKQAIVKNWQFEYVRNKKGREGQIIPASQRT